MSHFTVMVATPNGTPEEVAAQLAPFHEFECTGQDDEFVKHIDQLAEAQEAYAKDRADATNKRRTLTEFVHGWYGHEVVKGDEQPDLANKHKYGWVRVKDGDVVEVIDRTNPDKKWDWYQIGGRWTGFFRSKPGVRGVLGEPSLLASFAGTPRDTEGRADSLRKQDIDFEAMMDADGNEAGKRWDTARGRIGMHLASFRPWDAVREAHPGAIDAARKAYHEQPAVRALRAERDDVSWCNVEDFTVSREEYVQDARRRACTPFAFVRDRKWAERGSMGWWAIVVDEKSDWVQQFESLLADVPADWWLTVVDCHI